ncbi:hypothetical protein BT96DRAFT_998151 [Gymnopus androsaceus JB14]|uniref:Uncharacterized protein n=1 Tax=Gymnopus androsaceus JB14 TaxID=1447944 RepID=A0A6A4HB09_9AGAR|nr:hypothetical protein BT96DRAFT_998151 [Gymnopus androsaceus JB14]
MPKKKANNSKSSFNANSTRLCALCDRDIQIGFGGEANWQQHLNSTAHRNREASKISKSKAKTTITNFFRKASPPKILPESAAGPSRLSSIITVKGARPTSPILKSLDKASAPPKSIPIPNPLEGTASSSTGLTKPLRHLAVQLPLSVPIAEPTSAISAVTGDPCLLVSDPVEAWEILNPIIHSVFGYQSTADSIAHLVKRGPFGLDGFCNWVDACVEKLNVDEALLEPKVLLLLEATQQVLASSSTNTPGSPALPSSGNLHHIPSIDVDNIDYIQSSLPSFIQDHVPAPKIINVDVNPIPSSRSRNHDSALHVSPPPEIKCPGYNMRFLDQEGKEHSPFTCYPWPVHAVHSLPWNITVDSHNAKMFLHSHSCSGFARTSPSASEPEPCTYCKLLHNHNIIMGARHRFLDGVDENTRWQYLSPAQMLSVLERKTAQVRASRLQALNIGRVIATRNRRLDSFKRLSIAISTQDIPRIRSLMAVQLRNGRSIQYILEKIDAAVQRTYSPRSYDEIDFQRAFLMYKIDGRCIANIGNKALGIPSISSTKRRIAVKPLQASASQPTLTEMVHNLRISLPEPLTSEAEQADTPIMGMGISIDEVKIEERLRWEPLTNMILGVCQEHGHACNLEFRSIVEVKAILVNLREDVVHLASEATVMAVTLLNGQPKEYAARPFCISGTCKRENADSRMQILKSAIDAVRISQHHFFRRLYYIASDGAANQRRGASALTLTRKLLPRDDIFPALALLKLFNLLCGEDGITSDYDWKHVLKRFRNTLLRQKGLYIDGIVITESILKNHLTMEDLMSGESATSLLIPNDRQDITLMVRLLNSIASLPELPPSASPTTKTTRRILKLLGQLYRHLLDAYLDINASLSQQFTSLCFDVMSMIKNAYFCLAKTQRDNPLARLWLILLGTDGLEKVFGMIRSIVGNDSNADQLQLTTRVDGAVQCINILAEHPEYGGESRRLTVRSISEATDGDISSKYDHINPITWRGDVYVWNVVPLSVWQSGRKIAEEQLTGAGIEPPFECMEREGGYDILCPLGNKQIILVGDLEVGEENEGDDETYNYDGPAQPEDCLQPSHERFPESPSLNDVPETELAPDVEDTVADIEAAQQPTEEVPKKYEAWVDVSEGGGGEKRVHKSTILRLFSNPLHSPDSTDRARRVRGYSRYAPPLLPNGFNLPELGDSGTLSIEDPALTVVECDSQAFLAVIQVGKITFNGQSIQSLPIGLLHEPNVAVDGQIMSLKMIDDDYQPLKPDWEWNGQLKSPEKAMLRNVPGNIVKLINPELARPSHDSNAPETYVFYTNELRGIAAVIAERLASSVDDHNVTRVPRSASFPYRTLKAASAVHAGPAVKLHEMKAPDALRHIGAHILKDVRLKDANQPCGLCLNTGGLCQIYLQKRTGTKGVSVIDMKRSRCRNLKSFSIKTASEFKEGSPCTNHPLKCPLCPSESPAIWKYNFIQHINQSHHGARAEIYKELYELDDAEPILMKNVLDSKTRAKKKSKKDSHALVVSAAHSTRMVLRTTGIEGQEADVHSIADGETLTDIPNQSTSIPDSGDGFMHEDSSTSFPADDYDDIYEPYSPILYQNSHVGLDEPSSPIEPIDESTVSHGDMPTVSKTVPDAGGMEVIEQNQDNIIQEMPKENRDESEGI